MLDLVNYVLSGFMILVFLTWMFLLKTMIKDHAATPRLEREGSTDGPMVSVILPARNEEKYIEKCLESLAAQDYKNLEIIAIDDSSTDETGNIIKNVKKTQKHHTRKSRLKTRWMGWEKLAVRTRPQARYRKVAILYGCRYCAFTARTLHGASSYEHEET